MNICNAEGVVTAVKDGFVTVAVEGEKCGSCSFGCQRSRLSHIQIKTDKKFSEGDKVVLTIDSFRLLKYACLFYGTPILFMGAAASLSYILKIPDIYAALITVFSILPGWLAAKKISAKEKYPYISGKSI